MVMQQPVTCGGLPPQQRHHILRLVAILFEVAVAAQLGDDAAKVRECVLRVIGHTPPAFLVGHALVDGVQLRLHRDERQLLRQCVVQICGQILVCLELPEAAFDHHALTHALHPSLLPCHVSADRRRHGIDHAERQAPVAGERSWSNHRF